MKKTKCIEIDRQNRNFNLTTSIRYLTLSIRFWNRFSISSAYKTYGHDASVLSEFCSAEVAIMLLVKSVIPSISNACVSTSSRENNSCHCVTTASLFFAERILSGTLMTCPIPFHSGAKSPLYRRQISSPCISRMSDNHHPHRENTFRYTFCGFLL